MNVVFEFTRSGYPKPTHPTIRGRFERLLAPGYGYCFRCGRPFNRDIYHTTNYEGGSGCFPLCERCWAALTPMERVPYYDALVNNWISQSPTEKAEHERARTQIFRSVMSGG